MDVSEVRAFLAACVDELGLAFHPDTPFADYGDGVNGGFYGLAAARERQAKLDAALAEHGSIVVEGLAADLVCAQLDCCSELAAEFIPAGWENV